MNKTNRPTAAMLLLRSSSLLSGYLSRVAEHCSDCVVVREAQRTPLRKDPTTRRALVVMVRTGGDGPWRVRIRQRVGARGRRAETGTARDLTTLVMKGRPFFRDRIRDVPQMPPGGERIICLAKRAPAKTDPLRVYLGSSVSHDQAVALAGLPLTAKLSAPLDETTDGLVVEQVR